MSGGRNKNGEAVTEALSTTVGMGVECRKRLGAMEGASPGAFCVGLENFGRLRCREIDVLVSVEGASTSCSSRLLFGDNGRSYPEFSRSALSWLGSTALCACSALL